ncbi:hypothetical protein [Streptomyces sp. NPDC014894]|uniref:hypothetical protein n=1 Tax=Streptomyces sp. NPDC014894 TaxID=3364931 RepID=UPI0036F87DFC
MTTAYVEGAGARSSRAVPGRAGRGRAGRDRAGPGGTGPAVGRTASVRRRARRQKSYGSVLSPARAAAAWTTAEPRTA